MCLAIPGRIEKIDGNMAMVDYGKLTKDINITLVDVKVGQYVLVHAGYAIQVMDDGEARETLKLGMFK